VSEDDHADTIVGRVLKLRAPAWYWARENFSLPALLTIAGVIAAAGGYIITLRTRVVVLETEVVHITQIVPDSSMLAALKQQVAEDEARLTRLEANWDYAREHAGEHVPMPVRPRRNK